MNELDRDCALQQGIPGTIDFPHASHPEQCIDSVAPEEMPRSSCSTLHRVHRADMLFPIGGQVNVVVVWSVTRTALNAGRGGAEKYKVACGQLSDRSCGHSITPWPERRSFSSASPRLRVAGLSWNRIIRAAT